MKGSLSLNLEKNNCVILWDYFIFVDKKTKLEYYVKYGVLPEKSDEIKEWIYDKITKKF